MGFLISIIIACVCAVAYGFYQYSSSDISYVAPPAPLPPMLNRALYDNKLAYIARPLSANLALEAASTSTSTPLLVTSVASTTNATASSTASTTLPLWPVKTVYPNYGALLPFNRIVAYYGNFYTGDLGVLGQGSTDQMLARLMSEVSKWSAADPNTPVIPALDYIAVTAQGTPGPDGKYRLRMPGDQIEKAITLANHVRGLVILDIQVGQSNVQTEVPLLAPYLKLPNVELALDPEFAMQPGQRPGTVVGSMDATDINFAANFMAGIVRDNNLPPKILIVHRFTEAMVTDVTDIAPLPQVQIVMDMDGFGTPSQKTKVYRQVVADEPVQFTGLKLFYKNDVVPPSPGLMSDSSVLNLTPEPSFIQYQ